jgi:hypothetical protein
MVAVSGKGHVYGPKKDNSPEARAQCSYEAERALHEKVKREQREFQLAVEQAKYLPRDVQRQAASIIMAVLTQGLRSIPDNLERKFALPPLALDAITKAIDDGLKECSESLLALTDG